jgi:hypothetical protein
MMLILQRFLAHLAHRGFRMFEILAEKSILIVCIEPSSKKIAYILLKDVSSLCFHSDQSIL